MASSYLLYGPNQVDLQERVEVICQENDPDGFSTTSIDLVNCQLSDIDEAVNASPFFGGTRIAILKNVALSKQSSTGGRGQVDWSSLLPYLEHAPSSTSIIVTMATMLQARSRPVAFAKKAQWIVEQFGIPRGSDLLAWVGERVSHQGATIDAGAARLLLTRLFPVSWEQEPRYQSDGVDLQLLATELDKLVTAASNNAISAEDVEALVYDRSGVTAFKLNDVMFSGKPEQALEELDNMLSSGDVPERVLAQIGREITVLQAARCSDEYGAAEIAVASDVSPGQISMTISRKSGWRKPDALVWSSEALRQAEWLVKTGRSPRTASVIVPLVAGISSRFRG